MAPALVVMERIVARFIPDPAAMGVYPTPNSVVATLQRLGRDEDVPRFLAAWEELGSTPDGRAVVAVCHAAGDLSVPLGNTEMAKVAGNPSLQRKLAQVYEGCDFLPVLLAAERYYRADTPAAAGGTGGGCAAAASSGAAAAAAAAASRAAAATSRGRAAGGAGAAAGGAGGGARW